MSDPERTAWSNLPTLAEVNARPRPCPKGPSRVELKAAKDKSADRAWEECKAIVWRRDGGKCRRCGRHVVKSIELIPQRGEVHHIKRRAKVKALLTDPRNCLLVCLLPCHEGLTQNKFSIVGPESAMFEVSGHRYLDATSLKLTFIKKEAA